MEIPDGPVDTGVKPDLYLYLCWDSAICHFPVEVCLKQLPSETSVHADVHEAPYKHIWGRFLN